MQNEEPRSKDVRAGCHGVRVSKPEIAYLILANYCAWSPDALCMGLGASDCHAQIGTDEGIWTCGRIAMGGELHVELTLVSSDGKGRTWRIPFREIVRGVTIGGADECLCTSSCAQAAEE